MIPSAQSGPSKIYSVSDVIDPNRPIEAQSIEGRVRQTPVSSGKDIDVLVTNVAVRLNEVRAVQTVEALWDARGPPQSIQLAYDENGLAENLGGRYRRGGGEGCLAAEGKMVRAVGGVCRSQEHGGLAIITFRQSPSSEVAKAARPDRTAGRTSTKDRLG